VNPFAAGSKVMIGRARATAMRGIGDLAANLAFFTRLPIPNRTHAAPDWPRIAWAAPIAGAVVGAIGGLALGVAHALALPPLLSATLAIGALALTTGALHEDGLADVADGFGGGATREAKLAIMRDSRIGAFGTLALVLSTLLRLGALAPMARQGPGNAVAALILAGAVARAGALAPLVWLPPARTDGAGASAASLDGSHLTGAALSVVAVALVTGGLELDVTRAFFAAVLAAAAAYGMCALARRQIGGQTGDVAGATAQMCEIVALCALLIGGRDT
jgi:adenosylcobinamide-GDP ribazoletransferase